MCVYFIFIVPPERPMIVDSRGPLNGTQIGPMLEGDNLVLNCRVLGGKSLISFRETPFILCHFVISLSSVFAEIRFARKPTSHVDFPFFFSFNYNFRY